MFVLTADQRGSRRDVDRVEELLAAYRERPLIRPFERTAGDEVQGVADDANLVVDIALDLIRRGHWRVGIGVGAVDEPLPATTRAGRGPAFEAARVAVTRAKKTLTGIAVAGHDAGAAADAEACLALLGLLVARRSAGGHHAVAATAAGRSRSEVAATLGISKQAVSQRLAAAGWHAEPSGRRLAARLLREADT